MNRREGDSAGGAASSLRRTEERLAWACLALPLVVVLGVTVFPLAYNLWASVHAVRLTNLGGSAPFVGLHNFQGVTGSVELWRALATTLVYAFWAVSLSLLLGLVAALLLHRPLPARGLLRALFLFPYVAPAVAVAFVWRWTLSPVYGVANWGLRHLGAGGDPTAWLSTEPLALVTVILFEGWRYFPFDMLFLLARLQAIPAELYEAARVDGAGPWTTFRCVTLPELRGVMATLFAIRLLWTVNKFDDVFLLTGGAAGTRILPIWIYDISFRLYDFGAGAAASCLLLGALAVIAVPLTRRAFR
ncbi:MAG: sugar ABC transporter permease [Deferrisomatales bacterium]|nr:sugar ABC transporter permease [Deferrisomatales bacterium]